MKQRIIFVCSILVVLVCWQLITQPITTPAANRTLANNPRENSNPLNKNREQRLDTKKQVDEFARQHRQKMVRLIQSDPAAALKAALTTEQRATLPEGLLKNLEQPISGVGLLAKVVSCGGDHPSHFSHDAIIGGTRYVAHVYGSREDDLTRADIPLRGVALEGHIAIADEEGGR